MSRTPTERIKKCQIPVSDMTNTSTVKILNGRYQSVNRAEFPTVSIIKAQIPVSDLSRNPTVSMYKAPDTCQ